METIAEKECSALGGLFQLIVNDLKVGSPVWEDFLGKAAKLHSHLKTTVLALAAFLDAFQKIADLATGARGATKDIGTALTRLCLRHRSVEAKLKTFSGTIMDHLVIPLQERLEDWKKIAYQMDKDHAKEYKRVRQEIKKRSSDTLRLQKKVRKTSKGDTKKTLDIAIQDVNNKYHLLEETEKHALRRALIEERGRYCLFVSCIRPVVESELATLHEVSHLQEVLDSLAKLTEDPHMLPSASEQVIADVKSADNAWSFQTPPSSPTSLGSRKSSVCSISSLNSSSGDSSKSYSPSHHRSRSLSQQLPSGALRLLSVSSQDSGFTSQDTLFTRIPPTPALEVTNQPVDFSAQTHSVSDACGGGAASPAFPPPPSVTATWPNLQDAEQFEKSAAASAAKSQRPHTISSAYEHHARPPLTTQTFQPLHSDVSDRAASGDSAWTLISGCGETTSEFPEEQSDGDEFADDVTPTHKPSTPPLPPRSTFLNRAQPKIPQKTQTLRHRSKAACNFSVAGCRIIDPIYANAIDINPISPRQGAAQEHFEHSQDKPSFHDDLAAAIAQKALLHQKSIKTTVSDNEMPHLPPVPPPRDHVCATNAMPPIPPKTAAALERKLLPQAGQPPAVPPHKTSTDHLSKRASVIAEKETSWNVFTDSSDSSTAHAQLMQALNARLSVLQQQAEGPDGSQLQHADNRRFSVIETSGQDQHNVEFSSHTLRSTVAHRRPITAHPVRKPRAHSIGATDRETFLNTLNTKFAQMQQQNEPSSPQTSTTKVQTITAPSSINASCSPGLQDSNVPEVFMRRASQPLNHDNRTCPRISSYESSQSVEPASSLKVGTNIVIHQRPVRQDRRHSLNFNPDGSQLQTFFSPLASSNLPDDHSMQQNEGLDATCGMMSDAAARVQSWLAGRGSMDLSQCRVSLMGQIRQGINLRKAQTNDRSAPTFS